MENGVVQTNGMKNGRFKPLEIEVKENKDKENEGDFVIPQTCLRPMHMAMIICGCHSSNCDGGNIKRKALIIYRFTIFTISFLFLVKSLSCFWFIDVGFYPPQAIQTMWILAGFCNFLIGLKADSARFGHHPQAMQQMGEVISKLKKHGVEFEEKSFQRKQIILLTLAALIIALVTGLNMAHIPDDSFVEIFDSTSTTMPFYPSTELKIIVNVMTLVQMMLYTVPVFYVITLSIILRMQFRAFKKQLERQICLSSCKLPDSFQDLRILHNSLCGLVSNLDKDLKYYYGNSFVWKMLICLLTLYMMLKGYLNTAGLLAYIYFFLLSFGFLFAVSIHAALVHEAAHSPLDTIYYINVSDVNFEKLAQINLFLSKLTGTQVGFSTCGLLIITKEFILTIAGVFLTYFAVLYTL